MVCTIWVCIGLYLVGKVDPLIKREEVCRVVKNCIRCQLIMILVKLRLQPIGQGYHRYNALSQGCILVDDWLWTWVTGGTEGVTSRNSSCDCGRTGEGNSRTRSSGGSDTKQWQFSAWISSKHCLNNGTFEGTIEQLTGQGGNKIVEQYHWTVKAIAKRGGITLIEATFWYDM